MRTLHSMNCTSNILSLLAALGLLTACAPAPPTPVHSDLRHGDASLQDTSTLDTSSDFEALISRYARGEIDDEALREGLDALPHADDLRALQGSPELLVFTGSLWVSDDLEIPLGTTAILTSGAELILRDGVTLDVRGTLLAFGTPAAPVRVRSHGDERYQTLLLRASWAEFHHVTFEGGVDLVTVQDTAEGRVRFEDCQFEHWLDVALRFSGADGLEVIDSTFGLESADEGHGECLNGKASGALIQGNTFGMMAHYADTMDLEDCGTTSIPHILGNTLLGGEDDGIDLDRCDALVANNRVMNFWPSDPSNPYKGVNGGGITGHESSPWLINNVITGCYHGVGFKNGAHPTLIHNTVTGGHIGVTLYRTNASYPDPSATLINNIIWNNLDPLTGAGRDLVLNGKWWPSYDHSSDVQATVTLDHNLLGIPVGGVATMVADPLFAWHQDVPYLSSASPARGAARALGELGLPDAVKALALEDHSGALRPQPAALGALEVQQATP